MNSLRMELEYVHNVDLIGNPEKCEAVLECELASDPRVRS